MKKWYSYNLSRLAAQLIPTFLRRLSLVFFFTLLLRPLGRLINQILYKMQHTCQVIYLEKVLNESFAVDHYDPTDHEATKQISIGAGEVPDELYIYLNTEPNDPVWLDTDAPYLLTTGEIEADYCDFTVLVPENMQEEKTKIKSLVDYYKLAGKKYKIIWI